MNDEENSDEDVTDDEERTDTPSPGHEGDGNGGAKKGEENIISKSQVNDPHIEPMHVQGNEDAGLQTKNPNQEFSFSKIYSTEGPIDIDAAFRMDDDFSIVSPNDEWMLLVKVMVISWQRGKKVQMNRMLKLMLLKRTKPGKPLVDEEPLLVVRPPPVDKRLPLMNKGMLLVMMPPLVYRMGALRRPRCVKGLIPPLSG